MTPQQQVAEALKIVKSIAVGNDIHNEIEIAEAKINEIIKKLEKHL